MLTYAGMILQCELGRVDVRATESYNSLGRMTISELFCPADDSWTFTVTRGESTVRGAVHQGKQTIRSVSDWGEGGVIFFHNFLLAFIFGVFSKKGLVLQLLVCVLKLRDSARESERSRERARERQNPPQKI